MQTKIRRQKWQAENRERLNRYSREWCARNKERRAHHKRVSYQRNKEKISEQNQKRRKLTVKELVVEQHLIKAVEQHGGLCLKFIDPGRRGAPDRLVLIPGHPTYYVELKRPHLGFLEDHQKRYHAAIRAAGQRVDVLRSIEEIDAWIRDVIEW